MTSANNSISRRGEKFLFFPAASVVQEELKILDIMKII